MDRVNDFAFKIATANGTGSASANGLIMQAIFRMGVPVTGKNVFPSRSASTRMATRPERRISI
jgi:2-oxoglutarate ferredoxin oxidoreductase subunit alpha